MFHRVVAAGIVAAVGLLVAGCTVATPNFCCTDIDSCQRKGTGTITTCTDPARPFCDDSGEHGPSNTCIADPMTTACSVPGDCTTPARPVCDVDDTGTCVRCSEPADCTRFADFPFCDTGSGACVECVSSADCTSSDAPVCGDDHTCRTCVLDNECTTGVCNKGTGACVPENQIVFVAPSGGGAACTRASPCATITAGVTATDGTRRYILVAAGSYSERVTASARAFTLIGTGADLSAATAGPLFEIQGASNVAIEGLRVHDSLGSTGDGVRCSDAGGNSPSVTLLNVRIEANGGAGISANRCDLTINASMITGNPGGGLTATTGTHRIRNSFFTGNGGALTAFGGVKLDGSATGSVFEFNTVAGNSASSSFAAGVICSSVVTQAFSGNIVVGSTENQISATNCNFTYTLSNQAVPGTGNATTAPTFVDAATNDYHLAPGSAGIDAADPAATLATDFDGDVRPQGGRADIGADEAQ